MRSLEDFARIKDGPVYKHQRPFPYKSLKNAHIPPLKFPLEQALSLETRIVHNTDCDEVEGRVVRMACELVCTPLDDAPPYVALSYA